MTIIQQAAIAPAQDIGQQLFASFIAYIDRNEKTARTYCTNLRQFMAWMRFADVRRPARQDIIHYREWLTVEHDAIELAEDSPQGWNYRTDRSGNRLMIACKPNTVKQYLQSVKQFFSWTAANGLYPNIAANVHAPKIAETHRKDSLTAAEVQTIERAISLKAEQKRAAAAHAAKDAAGKMQRSTEQGARLYAMYLLAVNAGLRTIEISRANVKDIETKGGQAWLYVWGKGRTEADKKKAICQEVYAAIKQYLATRTDNPNGNSPLFVSTGNRSHGRRIAATTISKMLKDALRQAGYDSERLTAHSLRHTAGQAVMQITGDNIYKTQLYMRHSNPKTTEIYLDNNNAAQDAEIANLLYQHYHAGKPMIYEHMQRVTSGMMNMQDIAKELSELEQITGLDKWAEIEF